MFEARKRGRNLATGDQWRPIRWAAMDNHLELIKQGMLKMRHEINLVTMNMCLLIFLASSSYYFDYVQ